MPPGLTTTIKICNYYFDRNKIFPKTLEPAVKAGVAHVEKITGTEFGDKAAMPLLVSVRSGYSAAGIQRAGSCR